MLTNSYIHIPRIGASTEKKIWSSGIRSWDEFCENHHRTGMSRSKIDQLLEGIEESRQRLEVSDHIYFANTLPSKEHWRGYRHFKKDTLFLDIETTGLSMDRDEITMIGVYGGGESRVYINGIDLDEFPQVLEGCKTIVTFNGARFDLPFISRYFPEICFDQLHIDLMYPLRRIGLSGGLKHIETLLGLARSTETTGLTGFDAVRLWHRYRRGDQGALDTLIKYNLEDISHLETIIDLTYEQMMQNAYEQDQVDK
ncbi:MAG: ribonuclease H-like domain-containing protein [ANME-2 cluster archaeon]|nr:ribonuclease H-like domain-containing protein [ANME-2 cluster archaeon]